MRIGIISDTHGLLRPEAIKQLAGADHIIHAGDIGGPEILEKLRETRPDIGVLYMSGYADEDVARSGVTPESGFLRKPFTVQELGDAATKALSELGA